MASKLNRLLVSFIVALVIVTSTFVAYHLDLYSRWRPHNWARLRQEEPTYIPITKWDDLGFSPPAKLVSLSDIMKALWDPLITPISAESFVDYSGSVQTRGDVEPHWRGSLGKKLCIVDIDTRPLSKKHQILNSGNIAGSELDMTSSGMLNHYLYAMIHGYTYHFIHTKPLSGKAPFWTKIPALASTLDRSRCEITVSIDADASFMNLGLPFEWLLNRWNFTSTTSLALAYDPVADFNKDAAKGNTNFNAGFVIAHNNPRTHEILKAWSACPDDDVKYPNCRRWKKKWPAEQAAFSEYIRYEFMREEDIKAIKCGDANGYPESGTECRGRFIQHHWLRKDLVRPAVAESMMAGLIGRLRNDFVFGDASVEASDQAYEAESRVKKEGRQSV